MVEVKINNKGDVEAFINAQDVSHRRPCAAFIASRAALRVVPVSIDFLEFSRSRSSNNIGSLVVWRTVLISAIASLMPTKKIRSTASIVEKLARRAANLGINNKADEAARVAADAAASIASINAKGVYAANAAEAARAVTWPEFSQDAFYWSSHAGQSTGSLPIEGFAL